jgi:hypothetical protein
LTLLIDTFSVIFYTRIIQIIQQNTNPKSKNETMKISEEIFQRFKDHSRNYYNIETYDTIIQDLLNNFEKHNPNKYWFNNNIDK